MRNNKIIRWFLKHSLTIVSCVLITGLGIVFLVWSSPETTTIGEDISTGDITASGDVTISGSLEAKTGRTATLVVAAADSSTTSKAQADYVCDGSGGTDDALAIEQAITDLPAGGGLVYLLEGTYYASTSINITKNNVTLTGAGKATQIAIEGGDKSLNLIAASNLTGLIITNLYLNGTSTADDGFDDTNQNGVYFNNVDDSKIRNIWSMNNVRHGINLYNGSERNEVIGCECQSNNLYGIYLYNSSNNNTILGNTVQGNGPGIYLVSSSNNNTVSGNTVQGNSFGIYLHTSSNNTVSGNTVQGNTVFGIYLYTSSNNNTVSGNTVQGNGQYGIFLYTSSNNNTVSGNTVQGNGYDGIYLRESSSNNTVSGNTVQGNNFNGIYLNDSSNNNTISGNTVYDNGKYTASTYSGINLRLSGYNNIQTNTVRKGSGNTHQYGIKIGSGSINLVANNDLYLSGDTDNLLDSGTGTIIKHNRGYTTENSGLAILPAGSNSTTTDHGLAGTPSIVTVTATSTDIGNIAVTSKTSTQFTITTSATTTEDVGIYWYTEM